MEPLQYWANRLSAHESYIHAIFTEPYGTGNIFGIQFFLKRLDCKNFAFNPAYLKDMGVVVVNRN